MSVAITIQETVNEVDITVNQNVITVNVTRTTGGGGGGVESVTGDLVDNTDPLNPIVGVPTLQEITDNESGLSVTDGTIQATALVATNGVQGEEVEAIYGDDSVILRPQGLSVDFQRGANQGQLNANGIDDNYSWELPNQSGTIAMLSDIPTIPTDLISADSDNALTVGTDSKLFVAESTGTLPYQELIFTAFQTAPQTGITSGTLINGGRYTIFDNGTADFTISGAPNNDVGTVFIANSTPPDWGDFGTLDFEGNPVVTILNNPLSDTYTSHYTDIGSFYLEGLLDLPVDTFPKNGGGVVDIVARAFDDGSSNYVYFCYKNPSNDKQIIFKTTLGGDLTDELLDGSQLFTVKIFNP